jgi:hypothetical protein
MSRSSRKENLSQGPSNASSLHELLNGLNFTLEPTPRSTQQPSLAPQLGQLPFATQSQSQPLQQHEQPWPVCTWTAHAPPFGPSPFPRYCHALSATATAAGELFIFGGDVNGSPSNDLFVFSTLDFSSTLWHTSGNAPSPRVGHSAVLSGSTGTYLLIWGGLTYVRDQKTQTLNRRQDDSIYFLNLGTLDV